jgi:UDP-N-acetylmuramoylalanine--D-glutamate ligase
MHKDSKIAILGFGVEGQSVLRYLLGKGFFNITICDKDPNVKIPDKFQKISSLSWNLSANNLDGLEKYDIIFRSPGVHPYNLSLHKARCAGSKVTSATEFFLKNAKGRTIGVTGTKGKGTTSTMIHLILQEAGLKAYLGGNIGLCPLDFIDELDDDSFTVLEMSSFQLQDLTVSPDVAVILKTTSEHMDYHEHIEEYWEAKANILRHQNKFSYSVLNIDYDYAAYMMPLVSGQCAFVSTKVVFTPDELNLDFDIANYTSNKPENLSKIDQLRQNHYKDPTTPLAHIEAFLVHDVLVVKGHDNKTRAICKVEEVGLIGRHNLENILAAAAASACYNIAPEIMKKVFVKFTGLPNRLELVSTKNGVKFINDSFSTTPETTIAAINSFKESVHLLVGGSEKQANFSQLIETIADSQNLKSVIFMGKSAGKRLYRELNEFLAERSNSEVNENLPLFFPAESFEEAISFAKDQAQAGDIVLLSPACASFDWFENYKKRAEEFKRLVE